MDCAEHAGFPQGLRETSREMCPDDPILRWANISTARRATPIFHSIHLLDPRQRQRFQDRLSVSRSYKAANYSEVLWASIASIVIPPQLISNL
jgi:hypothetical protein